MNRADKLSFIFETGKRLRFYMDEVVMADPDQRPALCEELSGIQMKAAMQVMLHQPVSLSDLAAKLGVSPPSASVMVERLVEKRVLTRHADPEDRRRIQVAIHPKAEHDMNTLHERFQKAFDRIAGRVGNENVDRWYAVMRQIDQLLQEESA